MNYRESQYNIHFKHGDDNYIFNSLTSTLALFEKEPMDYVKDDETLSELLEKGFLVENGLDEVNKLEKQITKNINEIPKRVDITVVLTDDCNFRCVYCYQERKTNFFSTNDVDRLIVEIDGILNKPIEGILLHYFGGEPLLNYGILRRIDKELKMLCETKGKEYISYITTNGSLLSREILKDIEFDCIQFTFDGDKNTHSLLKKARNSNYFSMLEMVDLALANCESRINIRFNVCLENKNSFYNVINDIVGLSSFSYERVRFSFSPLRDYRNEKRFTELTQYDMSQVELSYKKMLIEKGVKQFLPRAIGQPCKFTVGNAFCIGAGLKTMFCTSNFDSNKNDNMDGIYSEARKYRFSLPNDCKKCSYAPLCLAGCRLLIPGDTACVTEKYTLIDQLRIYLDEPEMWVE